MCYDAQSLSTDFVQAENAKVCEELLLLQIAMKLNSL
jgi:hypothetical protein